MPPTTSATIGSASGAGCVDRADVVVGVVERRADEVVHAGVEDDEGLGGALLDVHDLGDQDAGIADEDAAGLEQDAGAEIAEPAADDLGIGGRRRRRRIVEPIGDAEAAAGVDVVDDVAVGAQVADEVGEPLIGGVEGRQVGDLAADMHVDAADPDAGQLGGAGIDGAGVARRGCRTCSRPCRW